MKRFFSPKHFLVASVFSFLFLISVRNAFAAGPVIYSISANPFETTATITWTSDSASTSSVNYGLIPAYGQASSSAILTTNHSITLTGLTASTTYHFAVSSGNSGGQTTSPDQTFSTVYSCTYYIDGVSGSDSNSGTTAEAPLKSLYALTTLSGGVAANSTICLRRGSTFNDSLFVGITGNGRNNITVQDYGPSYLPQPIIDGSSVIPPSAWTAVGGGFPNVYVATLPGPGNSTSTAYGTYTAGNIYINVWECKSAPCVPEGAGGNDQFLVSQTSTTSVNSALGSYWINGQTSGNPPGNPGSLTVYMSSTDGSNPATNGYTYTYSARTAALELDGTGDVVNRITTKKAALNDGSMVQYGDGGAPTFNNVEVDQGGKHNMLCATGCTVNNSHFYDEDYTAGGNMLVVFENTGQGKTNTITNTQFINGATTTNNSVTVFTNHDTSGPIGPLIYNGGIFRTKTAGSFYGSDTGASSSFYGITCDGLSTCFNAAATTTLLSGVAINATQSLVTVQSPSALSVGSSTYCGGIQNGIIVNGGGGTTTMTVASSTFFLTSGPYVINGFSGNGIGSISSNNNIFDGGPNNVIVLHLPGTTTMPYTGDNNTWNLPHAKFSDAVPGNWTSLAQWQAASGQDTHSNTAAPTPLGNNTSTSTIACVAPAYTFSGPSSVNVGSATTNYTITPNRAFTGTVTVTPTGAGAYGLSPVTLTYNNSTTAQGGNTFTLAPQVAGAITLTPTTVGATTSPTLEDPSAISLTSNATVPTAPQNVSAVAGNTTGTVTFQGPVSNGGSVITSYTITSSPGAISTTTTTTSGVVTGLTNGQAYTFTVVATNSVGTSASSTASNSVTPSTSATVTTSAASDITATAATLNGTITSTGGVNATVRGFAWGTTIAYGATTTESGSFGTGDFTTALSGLTCDSDYHFTGYATTISGTAYGSDQTFTTSACPSDNSGSNSTGSPAGGGGGWSTASRQAFLREIYAYNDLSCPVTLCGSSSATTNSAPTSSVLPAASRTFGRTLSVGMAGADIKSLQMYLNSHGYTLARSGPGSPGNETELFGGLTKKALMKFQKDHGLPSTGFFGPLTRGVINGS